MRNVLKIREHINPYLEYGTVIEEGKNPLVETRSGFFAATVAASCVLRPGQDDTVLLSLAGDGMCCIKFA